MRNEFNGFGKCRRPCLVHILIHSEGFSLETWNTKSKQIVLSLKPKIHPATHSAELYPQTTSEKKSSIEWGTSAAHSHLITDTVECFTHIWSSSSCTHYVDTHPAVGMQTNDLKKTPPPSVFGKRNIPKISQTNIWCQTSPPSEGPRHQPPRQTVVIGLQIQDREVLSNNKDWPHHVHVARRKQNTSS